MATGKVINEEKDAISKAWQEAEDARARAESAEGALEATRVDQDAELQVAIGRVEVEANWARQTLTQLCEAESALEARDLHITELDIVLQATEARAGQAEEEVKRVASLAEEREARVREVEATAEARVREVEAAAEARVAAVVEEFRAFECFTDKLAETSVDAYLQGFQRMKKKVARDLDFPRAMDVEPDHAFEVASFDDEAAAVGP